MARWVVVAHLPSGKDWAGETKVRVDGLRSFATEAEAEMERIRIAEALGYAFSRFSVEELPENTFTFTVTVRTDNVEQATRVIQERINHDEEYGFDYNIDYM